MRSKLIGGLAVAAAFLMAAPSWADGGHRHGNGRGHAYGHSKHWNKHHARSYYVHERYVVREVVRPVPVYPQAVYPAYPVAAPGIHVVLPSLFVPFY